MLNLLLKKIIRSGVGKARFVMAATGLSIALLLILAAVQVQVNYNELLYGETNQDSIANFLVINKKVSGNDRESTMSTAQIEGLKKQSFVKAVGELTSSKFKISAQSPSERFPFYTDLFFESVPNAFIDVESADWKWQPGSQQIPLIIPNQFLDLYNFGFAPSQNLMQLTQDMVMSIPVIINVQNHGQVVQFTGRVVGFSDRIASVLVPQNFLDWANKQFGTNQETKPSRVVIQTNDPGNPELVKYLKQNNLVTDADKTRFSKYRDIVNTIVNASWITGAVMLIFALLVFSLFIQLTIASTQSEIRLLVTLGTSPKQLQKFLLRQFVPGNLVIIVLSVVATAIMQYLLQQYLLRQNMHVSPWISSFTLLAALLVMAVLYIVNLTTIKKYIRQSGE